MKLKIFGFLLGIIAVSSISSAKAQSSETLNQNYENNKIIQIQAQNQDNSQQQPPLIDRKIFFGNPEISGAQLSPDGKYLAFRKPLNGVINIWVKRINEPISAARAVTEDKNRPIPAYFWSQDSQYILFAQDKAGNENFRIYPVSPTDKVAKGQVPLAKDLTPDDQVQARIYAVPENTPNTIIVGLNNRDPKFHDVYSINIATGERKLLYKNDNNVSNWVTDLEGN
ncbi:MAG: S9 family peptidase, partial [Cyanobacteria bacterium J06632_19]